MLVSVDMMLSIVNRLRGFFAANKAVVCPIVDDALEPIDPIGGGGGPMADTGDVACPKCACPVGPIKRGDPAGIAALPAAFIAAAVTAAAAAAA